MKFEGKTTLISSVTKNLLDENYNSNANHNILIAYFYIKHKQREKNTHNSLLRAIMEQIVARDTVLADHLFEELASVHGESLRSTKKLESLIATSLEAYRISFIVVDGLDEAAPGEAAKSLNWLLSLVQGGLKEPKASLRVLFSGQRDGILDNVLSKFPSVALDSCHEHEEDIRMYCAHKSTRIRQKFDISPEMEDEIISRVVSQANGKRTVCWIYAVLGPLILFAGMFLYARIVLDNLLSQTKFSRLKQEMQPDTFPVGIERA